MNDPALKQDSFPYGAYFENYIHHLYSKVDLVALKKFL